LNGIEATPQIHDASASTQALIPSARDPARRHGSSTGRRAPQVRWRFDGGSLLPYQDCLKTLTGTVRETRQRNHGDRDKVSVTQASLDARVKGP